MPKHDGEGGGGPGWSYVPGSQEKKEMRKQQLRERKLARKQQEQEEAEQYVVGSSLTSRQQQQGGNSSYLEYQAPIHYHQDASYEEEDDDNAEEVAQMHMTVKERKLAEKKRKEEEKLAQQQKRDEEANARARRAAAAEREQELKDPRNWPTLKHELIEKASELVSELDQLWSDPLTRDNSSLRVQYAIMKTRQILGDRVKSNNSNNNSEIFSMAAATLNNNNNNNEGGGGGDEEEAEKKKKHKKKHSHKKRSQNHIQLADAVDAIVAHGRADNMNLLDILNALSSSKALLDVEKSNSLRFAVEAVLRGSCWTCLAEMDIALTFFAPQLLTTAKGQKKEVDSAATQLRLVWKNLIDSIPTTSTSTTTTKKGGDSEDDDEHEEEEEDGDNNDDGGFDSDALDEQRSYIANLSVGLVRTLNSIATTLKGTENPVVFEQIFWLMSTVANKIREVGFSGPATHSTSSRPLILQADTVATIVKLLNNRQHHHHYRQEDEQELIELEGEEGEEQVEKHQRQVQRDQRLMDDTTNVLLLCGIRHHQNFMKVSVPSIIKRCFGGGADHSAITTTTFGVHLCASFLVSTSDESNIVPQAPTGDRFISVIGTEQLVRVLGACRSGPIERTIADEIVTLTEKQLESNSNNKSVDEKKQHSLQQTVKILKGIKRADVVSVTLATPKRSASPPLNSKTQKKEQSAAAVSTGKNQQQKQKPASYKPPLAPLAAADDDNNNKTNRDMHEEDRGSLSLIITLALIFVFSFWGISVMIRTPNKAFLWLKQYGVPVEHILEFKSTIEGLTAKYLTKK